MEQQYDAGQLVRINLIKQQLHHLDEDLALHVVLSALSLNHHKILRTTQIMSHLQAMRKIETDPSVTDQDKQDFEYAQHFLAGTYLDRNEKAQ